MKNISSSNGLELKHPWYYRKNSNQLCAGSDVIFESGSECVLDYRVDYSKHNNTQLHINRELRVGPSGCELSNQTSLLKKADKKLKTNLHYIPI